VWQTRFWKTTPPAYNNNIIVRLQSYHATDTTHCTGVIYLRLYHHVILYGAVTGADARGTYPSMRSVFAAFSWISSFVSSAPLLLPACFLSFAWSVWIQTVQNLWLFINNCVFHLISYRIKLLCVRGWTIQKYTLDSSIAHI